MTLQEPNNPPFADVDVPDTEVIVVAHPSPVFVDSTGRRRRLLRRVAYGFGALCMVYGGLISVSLAGGPVSSSAVLPLPDLADGGNEEDTVVARPRPTPEPFITSPSMQPILEIFPRRGVPVTRRTEARVVTPRSSPATPRSSRTPSPTPTKKPATSPATPRPVESATTQPPEPQPSETSTAPEPPVVPPAPPPIPGGTGGSGGGSTGGTTGQSDAEPVRAPADEDPADTDPQPPAPPAKPVDEPEPESSGEEAP